MAERSFSEQLQRGLADAIADIREKVVEEPMWGRVVTERGEMPDWPKAEEVQAPGPQGLDGEILQPETAPVREPQPFPRLEHGTIVEGQVVEPGGDFPQWPQAAPGGSHTAIEHSREQERDMGMER